MESTTDRLVWFELEVCPNRFRFAARPGHPVLFGCQPGPGQPPRTLLMRYQGNEASVDSLIESLAALVRSNRILSTPPHAPEQAFTDDSIEAPSVHIRIAYAGDRRWAAMYSMEDLPANVQKLIEQSRELGLRVLGSAPSRAMSGEEAMEMVSPQAQPEASKPAAVVAKVKVTLSGEVYLNGHPVSLEKLREGLGRVGDMGGEVWYYRESPQQEPPPEVRGIVKSVINTISELKLSVRLSQTDFD